MKSKGVAALLALEAILLFSGCRHKAPKLEPELQGIARELRHKCTEMKKRAADGRLSQEPFIAGVEWGGDTRSLYQQFILRADPGMQNQLYVYENPGNVPPDEFAERIYHEESRREVLPVQVIDLGPFAHLEGIALRLAQTDVEFSNRSYLNPNMPRPTITHFDKPLLVPHGLDKDGECTHTILSYNYSTKLFEKQ